MFLGHFARVENCSNDKYGRLLCDVIVELEETATSDDTLRSPLGAEINVANFVLTNALGHSYFGESKPTFRVEEISAIMQKVEKLRALHVPSVPTQ